MEAAQRAARKEGLREGSRGNCIILPYPLVAAQPCLTILALIAVPTFLSPSCLPACLQRHPWGGKRRPLIHLARRTMPAAATANAAIGIRTPLRRLAFFDKATAILPFPDLVVLICCLLLLSRRCRVSWWC